MWGEHTHLSMVEYWRWWLVHLWVEGFFEVFATAVIAFLFTRLGLLPVTTATVAVLFATIVFMAGGVLGTLHHLYFAGTPTAVLALGASFSALEVVPLAYIGFEAYHTYKLGSATPWMVRYRWPILFFVAVAFWNLVGRRAVRLPDQSAAVALLHAGPESHAAARAHRPVRRVRHAGDRAGAVLSARTQARHPLERAAAQDVILVAEHRPRADGCH